MRIIKLSRQWIDIDEIALIEYAEIFVKGDASPQIRVVLKSGVDVLLHGDDAMEVESIINRQSIGAFEVPELLGADPDPSWEYLNSWEGLSLIDQLLRATATILLDVKAERRNSETSDLLLSFVKQLRRAVNQIEANARRGES
ncbi:MAG: hypothetical protein ACRC8A_12575 [Microcoleaceae cyanobacterium]